MSLVREWVLFIYSFILSMGSLNAVLSTPRTLDIDQVLLHAPHERHRGRAAASTPAKLGYKIREDTDSRVMCRKFCAHHRRESETAELPRAKRVGNGCARRSLPVQASGMGRVVEQSLGVISTEGMRSSGFSRGVDQRGG